MGWCATATLAISNSSSSILTDKANQSRTRARTPTSLLQLAISSGRRKQIGICSSITMRDRSKNRKPLQRGRNLSIEAIQTVQALKRANNKRIGNDTDDEIENSLEPVFASIFRRLLKLDMMAVLRELLRQNECMLALKVFEDIRKEYWYKPQTSLYAEIVSVLGRNGLSEKVDLLFSEFKKESNLEPDTEGFNALLESLMNFNVTGLTMECFYFMKSLGCDPDRLTFRILINGLELNGETSISASVRHEAQKYYGSSLEFPEQEEMTMS